MSEQKSGQPSVAELQAQIEATRARLSSTVDQLTTKAAPKALLDREKENAKARFAAATRTPEGDLRTERLAAVAAAVVVLMILRCILRRRSA
ncbi:MAG: DUF3618 domain-containing protein [Tetrasphaera sp.]|nr:DUF3618 domain-containing protein [Tetrasphaera sp.]